MKSLIVVAVVLAVLIIGGIILGIFVLLPKVIAPTPAPVACTMEAKLCPDGSYVGRTGPNCEFAPCPSVSEPTSIWKTVSDTAEGFEYSYPETLGTKYIDANVWPPKVTVADGKFSCETTSPASSLPNVVTEPTIDNRVYCVTAVVEEAAGSAYITYTYATEENEKIISLDFVLRYPRCINYDDSQKTECQIELDSFDLDGLVGQIAATFKFTNAGTVSGSGIEGIVLLGPTCPVEKNPPEPQCADKPYKTNLDITSVSGTQIVKEFSSGANGKFKIDLPPGEYAIQSAASSNALFPRCATSAVTVAAGSYTNITINCDTGIRQNY
jgi:hypothetical protein